MIPKTMDIVLEEKFNRLESRYTNLKNHLALIDESLLNINPRSDKWSVLQILWHLQTSESLSLRYLNKKLAGGPYPATGFVTDLRCLLLKWVLASPLKFNAPAAVRENIPVILKKNELFADFESNREDMKKLLAAFPQNRQHEALYKHPRIGYINISQMLDFLFWHFTHHEKQIHTITNS